MKSLIAFALHRHASPLTEHERSGVRRRGRPAGTGLHRLTYVVAAA